MKISPPDYLINKKNISGIALAIAISILYILPLIMVNQYYMDDNFRIFNGHNWNIDGRFLATWISRLLSLNSHAINAFPFTLIISAAALGLVGYWICEILDIEKQSKFKASALLLITSPYLLQNLSYRFDILTMTLSVVIIVVPFLYRDSYRRFLIASAIALYLAFGLYQASTMTYFAMLLCYLAKQVLDRKLQTIPPLLGSAIAAFFISFVLYKLSILALGIEMLSRGEIIILQSGFSNILFERIHELANFIFSSLLDSSYAYGLIIFVLISIAGLVRHCTKDSSKPSFSNRLLCAIVLFLIFIALLIVIGLPNLVTKVAVWDPRVMISFPFLLVFLALFLRSLSVTVIRVAVLCLIYYSFLLVSVYADSLKNNDEYGKYLTTLIAPYAESKEFKHLVIAGKSPIPPRNQLLFRKFPILNYLAEPYEKEHKMWGFFSLTRFTQKDDLTWPRPTAHQQILKNKCSAKPLAQFRTLTLKQDKDTLIVDFKDALCP